MSELTSVREIVEELAVKEPIFRRKSAKCSNSHHKHCGGHYRAANGDLKGCMCPCHTAVQTDPDL